MVIQENIYMQEMFLRIVLIPLEFYVLWQWQWIEPHVLSLITDISGTILSTATSTVCPTYDPCDGNPFRWSQTWWVSLANSIIGIVMCRVTQASDVNRNNMRKKMIEWTEWERRWLGERVHYLCFRMCTQWDYCVNKFTGVPYLLMKFQHAKRIPIIS